MPSGRGDGLPTEQIDWIETNVIDYLRKTDLGKFFQSGDLNPKDDTDLKDYRKEFFKRFTAKFSHQIDTEIDAGRTTPAIIRRKFEDLLRNCKSTAKDMWIENQVTHLLPPGLRKSSKTSTRIQHLTEFVPKLSRPNFTTLNSGPTANSNRLDKMWRDLCRPASLTGRFLFERENCGKINEIVKTRRTTLGFDQHQHPAMFKSTAKELWDELNDFDKEVWNSRAKADDKSDEMLTLASNHDALPQTLKEVLDCLIGPQENGNHKIGQAKFHVLYGFRKEDDSLVAASVEIGQDGLDPGFRNFYEDFDKNIGKPWAEYCLSAIQSAHPKEVSHHAFACGPQGCPIFPSDTPDDDLKLLRQLLSDFVAAQWEWSQPATAMPTDPQGFLKDSKFPLVDPLKASMSRVGQLLEEIVARQGPNGWFQLFLDKKGSEPRVDGPAVNSLNGERPSPIVRSHRPSEDSSLKEQAGQVAQDVPAISHQQTQRPAPSISSSQGPTTGDNIEQNIRQQTPASTPALSTIPPREDPTVDKPTGGNVEQGISQPTSSHLAPPPPFQRSLPVTEKPAATNNELDPPPSPERRNPTSESSDKHKLQDDSIIRKKGASRKRKTTDTDIGGDSSVSKRQKGNEPPPRRSTRKPGTATSSSTLVPVPNSQVVLRSGKTAKASKRFFYVEIAEGDEER